MRVRVCVLIFFFFFFFFCAFDLCLPFAQAEFIDLATSSLSEDDEGDRDILDELIIQRSRQEVVSQAKHSDTTETTHHSFDMRNV